MMNYVYIAVAVAFLGMGAAIKYQANQIDGLKKEQAIWTAKNEELAGRIDDQNQRLRDGEEKYNKVQQDLAVAKGQNTALAKEYEKLRGEWKGVPLPKTCDEAIVELKSRSAILAGKWNNAK